MSSAPAASTKAPSRPAAMRWVAPIWLPSPPPIKPQFIGIASGQANLLQILKIGLCIRERRSNARRVAVLLHGSPPRKTGRRKCSFEGAEVDHALAQVAEQTRGTRIVKANTLIDGFA